MSSSSSSSTVSSGISGLAAIGIAIAVQISWGYYSRQYSLGGMGCGDGFILFGGFLLLNVLLVVDKTGILLMSL